MPLLLFAGAVNAQPYIPKDGKQVLEHLPATNQPEENDLKLMRAALAVNPNNLELAVELSKRLIEKSRNEGDPRYLGYAQAALSPWWKMAAPPIAILVLRATVLQSTHRFDEAMVDLNEVLKRNRHNGQAWLTRATILQVQGKYAEATKSCQQLYPLAPELITMTCLNNIANLSGQADKSYKQLKQALFKTPNVDSGIQVWVLTLLAEMADRMGNTVNAQQHFKQALALEPPDTYLLGSYSDFLLDQKRPAEVISLLKDKTRVDALLLRYALALKALHSPEAVAQTTILKQRFDAAMLRGDTVHQREQSRFELHLQGDARTALKVAQLNWVVQKEPADVRIFLEAASAANDKNAAQKLIEWLKRTGLEYGALTPLISKLKAGG